MTTPPSKQTQWREPEKGENAGIGSWHRSNAPYDDFMESEGVPIHRGIGVHRVQDLPLKPWKRLGGSGTFIQLCGTEGLWGCYVVEVPGAAALNAEQHMYEEIYLVVEGPFIRNEYESILKKEGVTSRMSSSLYERKS